MAPPYKVLVIALGALSYTVQGYEYNIYLMRYKSPDCSSGKIGTMTKMQGDVCLTWDDGKAYPAFRHYWTPSASSQEYGFKDAGNCDIWHWEGTNCTGKSIEPLERANTDDKTGKCTKFSSGTLVRSLKIVCGDIPGESDSEMEQR